jgi:hypothetical protein
VKARIRAAAILPQDYPGVGRVLEVFSSLGFLRITSDAEGSGLPLRSQLCRREFQIAVICNYRAVGISLHKRNVSGSVMIGAVLRWRKGGNLVGYFQGVGSRRVNAHSAVEISRKRYAISRLGSQSACRIAARRSSTIEPGNSLQNLRFRIDSRRIGCSSLHQAVCWSF